MSRSPRRAFEEVLRTRTGADWLQKDRVMYDITVTRASEFTRSFGPAGNTADVEVRTQGFRPVKFRLMRGTERYIRSQVSRENLPPPVSEKVVELALQLPD